MERARRRARRSRYNVSYRLTRSVPAVVGALLLVVVIVTATLTYKRIDDFVTATPGRHVHPIGEGVQPVEPAPGTIPYKPKHGQHVNILLLGPARLRKAPPYPSAPPMARTLGP